MQRSSKVLLVFALIVALGVSGFSLYQVLQMGRQITRLETENARLRSDLGMQSLTLIRLTGEVEEIRSDPVTSLQLLDTGCQPGDAIVKGEGIGVFVCAGR